MIDVLAEELYTWFLFSQKCESLNNLFSWLMGERHLLSVVESSSEAQQSRGLKMFWWNYNKDDDYAGENLTFVMKSYRRWRYMIMHDDNGHNHAITVVTNMYSWAQNIWLNSNYFVVPKRDHSSKQTVYVLHSLGLSYLSSC